MHKHNQAGKSCVPQNKMLWNSCVKCYYASVGGAPEAYGIRRVCVCVRVCLYVFHTHFSATVKN